MTRRGRPPATSRAELSTVALGLFARSGFEDTTVDQIAVVAGISRRSLFRYVGSKSDLVWGDFDGHLEHMRGFLAQVPEMTPVADALRTAIVDFNTVPSGEAARHRLRLELILHSPTLVAESALRYASWRAVVAGYVAARTGEPVDGLIPQAAAYAHLGVAIACYEAWLATPGAELVDLLDAGLAGLASAFDLGPAQIAASTTTGA